MKISKLGSIVGLMCLPWVFTGCQNLPTNTQKTQISTAKKTQATTPLAKTQTKSLKATQNTNPSSSGTTTNSYQKTRVQSRSNTTPGPSTKHQKSTLARAGTKLKTQASPPKKNKQWAKKQTIQTLSVKDSASQKTITPPKTMVSDTVADKGMTLAKLHQTDPSNPIDRDQPSMVGVPSIQLNEQTPTLTQVPLAPHLRPTSDQLSLQDLPLSIDSHWQLVLDGVPGKCSLKTHSYTMEDGQGGTNFKLMLNQEKLRFKTTSNIDLSYEDDGLWVNKDSDTQRFEFDTLEDQTNAIIDSELTTVFEQLRQARSLEVRIGFWPTWPKTQSYSQHIPVNNFAQAEALLNQCTQLVSGR